MISISNIQAEILEKFTDYDLKTQGEVGKGLSNAALGKRGINRRTFELNENFLLNHYLIKLVHIEKHGIQTWKYYDITPLGVFSYLKWCRTNRKQSEIIHSKRFFPYLVKHEKNLKKLIGDSFFNHLVNDAIRQIDVYPEFTISDMKGKELGYPTTFIEKTIIEFNTISILFHRIFNINPEKKQFGAFTKKGEILGDKEDVTIFVDDRTITDRVIDKLTFLFFYNLLGNFPNSKFEDIVGFGESFMARDDSEVGKLLRSLNSKPKGKQEKSLLQIYQNLDKVISMVKKDQKLVSLIKNNLTELTTNLQEIKPIKDLQKIFS